MTRNKQKNSIYIASDSRYSLKGDYTDSGPKIFKMPTSEYSGVNYTMKPE